jgi:hypothetical protein
MLSKAKSVQTGIFAKNLITASKNSIIQINTRPSFAHLILMGPENVSTGSTAHLLTQSLRSQLS